MDDICYIFAASKAEDVYIDSSRGSFVIAADAGYRHILRLGLRADLVVGDFDSLGYEPEREQVVYHQPEKDDTDTMLAIKEGLRRGYRSFVIYGGLGGRLDHSLANIQSLLYLAERGARGYMAGEGLIVTVIKNSALRFGPEEKGVISVFCPDGRTEGVYLEGLKYPLANAVLESGFPLGVSNEFTGREAVVRAEKGSLVVMWSGRIVKVIGKSEE